jgi:AraC-like DNA-binding protein
MAVQADESTIYDTISSAYGISLLVFNDAGVLIEQHSPHPANDELLFSISNCRERLFDLCGQTRRPQIISGDINQHWAGMSVIEGDRTTKIIVIGPVHTSEFSKSITIDYARSYDLPAQPRERLLEALRQTPVCPYVELTRLLSMIFSFIYGEELDTSLLSVTGRAQDDTAASSEKRALRGDRVYNEGPYPNYRFEQYLTECVREGKLERLKRHLATATFGQSDLLGEHDPIRQQKDMFIIAATLASRAAIEGGLHPKTALSLSFLYIEQVEIMRDFPSIATLTREMLYDFTTRVSNQKHTRRYSKLIKDCCDYIDEHVREDLRVTTIGAFTGLNSHYVSRKFREETGQSINEFIRAAKISEAKTLLQYSDLSLVEISELLSFSSQSFFTSTFRQVTGVTPGQYREHSKN